MGLAELVLPVGLVLVDFPYYKIEEMNKMSKIELNTRYVPIVDRPHPIVQERGGGDDWQWLFRFSNGYGASVVWSPIVTMMRTPGLELVVIKFNGDGDTDWDITYGTPITDDVINGLDSSGVEEILSRIESL